MLDTNVALQQWSHQWQIQLSITSFVSFQCIFFILPEIKFSVLDTVPTETLKWLSKLQLLCVESFILYKSSITLFVPSWMSLQLDASNLSCIVFSCIELAGWPKAICTDDQPSLFTVFCFPSPFLLLLRVCALWKLCRCWYYSSSQFAETLEEQWDRNGCQLGLSTNAFAS